MPGPQPNPDQRPIMYDTELDTVAAYFQTHPDAVFVGKKTAFLAADGSTAFLKTSYLRNGTQIIRRESEIAPPGGFGRVRYGGHDKQAQLSAIKRQQCATLEFKKFSVDAAMSARLNILQQR